MKMAFGGHIANVAREGIWASLTGGWYYEPKNSLFCNTLHLYIWSLLFILPILFGLSINENDVPNYGYAVGYLTLLGFIFVCIKISVAYLHHIFDTVQPIKYKSKKNIDEFPEEFQRCANGTRFSGSSISATRATECNALETIEMVDIRRNLNRLLHEAVANDSEQSDEDKTKKEEKSITKESNSGEFASLKQRRKRKRRAIYYHSLPSFSPSKRNSTNFVDGDGNRETAPSKSSVSACDLNSANVLPKLMKNRRNGRPTIVSKGLIENTNVKQSETDHDATVQMAAVGSVNEQQEPCCSSSLFVTSNVSKGVQNSANKIKDYDAPKNKLMAETIRENSMDFVMQPAHMSEAEDLKGQITKFLEELIAKHPEAMDAIESVRMNRLMKCEAKTETEEDDRPAEDEKTFLHKDKFTNEENAGDSPSQSHHLAINSMDTTAGAVHAFQDEQGNWLTYWFGPKSSGTAQPFMHVPALSDKSNCEAVNRIVADDSDNDQSYKEQPTVVNVIDTSSVRDAEKGQTRIRLSTSSSSDSFSSVDQPTKKIHADNSSSSDEANRYLMPINLLRTNALHEEAAIIETGGPPNAKVELTAQESHGSSDSSSHLTLMQRLCHITNGELESAPRIVPHSRARAERLPMVAASNVIEGMEGSSFRLLNDLQMGRPLPSSILFYHSVRDALTNRPRQKYCYRLMLPNWLNWWPFGREKAMANCNDSLRPAFTLKLDRLSLVTIFDRNFSAVSFIFDIFLAFFVGLLAVLMLYRKVYTEISLLFFAFTVAGAQFSLLKSVQPDSSSPVHGFNWLVAYSRPIYFVIFSSIVLFLNWTTFSVQASINWLPSWLRLYSDVPLHLSLHDFCADFLLFLPFVFTFGLLPQINTLFMHLLEQIDMHFFGSTASLSLVSSIFSLCRSVFSVAVLVCLVAIVQLFSYGNNFIAFVGFSVFVSLTNAIAYLLSRESSSHQFVTLLWNIFWRNLTNANTSAPATRRNHINRKESQHKSEHSSQSTLDSPSKKLLNCCIFTNDDDNSVTRRNTSTEQKGRAKKEEEMPEEENTVKEVEEETTEEEEQRPLEEASTQTLILRAQHNLFSAALRFLFFFGMHRTLLFQTGQPLFQILLSIFFFLISLLNHYFYTQMRAKNPWKLLARPIFRSHEYDQFEPKKEAELTCFEKIHLWMVSVEKNVFFPLLAISLMSTSGMAWNAQNGLFPILVLTICAFRLIRTGYTQPNLLHIPLLISFLIHKDKFGNINEDGSSASFLSTPLFTFFVVTIVWSKFSEFLLKAHFILCYIAPWQISWGSAFHAFAQPFSIPHSGLTLAQALFSSILSAPLNPFLGSSFFLMSYIRPTKFWERDYNTKRVDHSKLRLVSQLDRSPMIDDSNLNSIFYEHLTRSLQISLAGDLLLGRWACTIQPGDCFILSSNYLNCMIHLVECGNGFVTFQLRGLEFRGTYCHQREMEAISEDWAENNATFCCSALNSSPFLSLNNAWALRWLAWEVTVAKYVVDGYSISDNSAVNMLQIHELRRLLVSLYVKCMIFYAIDSPQLSVWLADDTILTALDVIRKNSHFVDLDPVFCAANDEDFDINIGGLSRQSFLLIYSGWIEYCLKKRSISLPLSAEESAENGITDVSLVTSFCFALSMLGRRALGTAAYNRHSSAAESFLFGMHTLFKGDMRIAHPADEWVFADLDILSRAVAPAIRMALKLHQDHFTAVVDLDEPAELFDLIEDYRKRLFISHEHDPEWRHAILANKPSLLALRHICDDGQQGDYKIIMLNKRHLDMRVIKLNRECVRAFWAGQQQELIFLRNKNPERGSIQNARQVLRNIINSSADQPIGYPIYVSPLTTSFVETHNQLGQVLGPPLTLSWCSKFLRSLLGRIRTNFGPSGGSAAIVTSQQQPAQNAPPTVPSTT